MWPGVLLLLTEKSRCRAAQLHDRRVRRIALVVEHLLRRQLLVDHAVLVFDGSDLPAVDVDLALCLLDLLANGADLSGDGGRACREQLLLRPEQRLDGRLFAAREEIVGEFYGFSSCRLGLEPGDDGFERLDGRTLDFERGFAAGPDRAG